MRTDNKHVIQFLALVRDVFQRHCNDETVGISGEQSSWREALFTSRIYLRDTLVPETIGCRDVGGCGDGCLTVHRHHDQSKSGADVKPFGEAAKEHEGWWSDGRFGYPDGFEV